MKFNFSIIDIGESAPVPSLNDYSNHIPWYKWGDDDDFPNYLIDVYKVKSITQKAIINRKVKMLAVGFEESKDPRIKMIIDNMYSEDSLDDILYKCAMDFYIVGAFAIELIYNRKGEIVQVEHTPIETVRKGRKGGYYISKDFNKRWKYKPEYIDGFSKERNEKQLLFVSKFESGVKWEYPIPNWYSSINYILSEWEISQFHYKNVQTGFSAGYLFNILTGDVSDEEKDEINRVFEQKFTGTYNTGAILLNWADSFDRRMTIDPINTNNNDEKFIELMKIIRQQIMTSNGITNPQLYGIDESGGVKFSSKGELKEMVEIYQLLEIDGDKRVFETAFNKILRRNGISDKMYMRDLTIELDIKEAEGEIEKDKIEKIIEE